MPIVELEEYISRIGCTVRKNYHLSLNSSFPFKSSNDNEYYYDDYIVSEMPWFVFFQFIKNKSYFLFFLYKYNSILCF